MRNIDPIILAGLAGMTILMVEGLKTFLAKYVEGTTLERVVVPLMVLGLSTVLYTAFSMLYPPFTLNQVIIEGLTLGFVSSGIYSIGKKIVEPPTPIA